MRKKAFFLLIPALFLVFAGCQHHEHSKATAEKDKAVLTLNHCDYTPASFKPIKELYQWPENDLNTPYGAGLRMQALRAVISGLILDDFQAKQARTRTIAAALGLQPRPAAILKWAKTEAKRLQTIPEVKKRALNVSKLLDLMAAPNCANRLTALKTWSTSDKWSSTLTLLYGISQAYGLLTLFLPQDQWLQDVELRSQLQCIEPGTMRLDLLMLAWAKLLIPAVRAGMNDPDPALATVAMQAAKLFNEQGLKLPFALKKKGFLLGIDMPRSIRPVNMWHHPDYLILVKDHHLRVVTRPVIRGLETLTRLPKPKTLLDLDIANIKGCGLTKEAKQVLKPLLKTWKFKSWGITPLLCDRNATAGELLTAADMVVAATQGYPVLAVFGQDHGTPGFIPLNILSPARGFIRPDGLFNMYDKRMQPVTIVLNKGAIEVQTKKGKPPEVFDFSMDKLPDLRPAYGHVEKLAAKDRYLNIIVAQDVPVWSLVSIMQTMFFKVSKKDLVSIPAFLGAGLGKEGRKLPPLFDNSFVSLKVKK